MLDTRRKVSPVWQSEGKVKLLFMTFKMARGRQVGLCIKFIWNLHFDWPTVWANSTVTYWSDRDFWQLWTIAKMAFKTQTARAGEIFPVSHLIHLLSTPPTSPTSPGVAFYKANGDIFSETQDEHPPGVSLRCFSFPCVHPCFLSPSITFAGSLPPREIHSRFRARLLEADGDDKCVSRFPGWHLSKVRPRLCNPASDTEPGIIPISLPSVWNIIYHLRILYPSQPIWLVNSVCLYQLFLPYRICLGSLWFNSKKYKHLLSSGYCWKECADKDEAF